MPLFNVKTNIEAVAPLPRRREESRAQKETLSVAMEKIRTEALNAHSLLGVKETFFLDFPAPALDQYPGYKISMVVSKYLRDYQIDTVYIPHRGDIHKDHKMVFDALLVACRPVGDYFVKRIYAYETLSETEWAAPYSNDAFIPTVFCSYSENEFSMKMKAMQCYKSQLRAFPHSRSLETLEALAKFRGATVTRERAETFMLIREII
ncbi:MAG: PIG-L family deacetylase [Bacteroidales bacterium]|nr:PIG-L family deacetylase [Bacteroidales bacterium]